MCVCVCVMVGVCPACPLTTAAAIVQGFMDESSKQYWEGQFRYFSFTTFVELRWVSMYGVWVMACV